jgi:hypothetical protein
MSETRASTPDGPFYLAMGRFVVEFSQFVFFLQEGCILVAQQGHHDIQPQLRIATIQLTDRRLVGAFFATCNSAVTLDADERQIRDSLNSRADRLVAERNRILHGQWVGSPPDGETLLERHGLNYKIAPTAAAGIADRTVKLTASKLEQHADEAVEMGRLVWEFAVGCAEVRLQVQLRIPSGAYRF